MPGDVVDVLAQQRLTAGQDEHLGPEGLHLVDQAQALGRRELAFLLVAATAVSTWQAVRATRAGAEAESGPAGGD